MDNIDIINEASTESADTGKYERINELSFIPLLSKTVGSNYPYKHNFMCDGLCNNCHHELRKNAQKDFGSGIQIIRWSPPLQRPAMSDEWEYELSGAVIRDCEF